LFLVLLLCIVCEVWTNKHHDDDDGMMMMLTMDLKGLKQVGPSVCALRARAFWMQLP